MTTWVENINRDLIEWAILRAGREPEEFYIQYPVVEKWVEGKVYPTVKQLENFTRKLHLPFGYMFLKEPPKEEIPIPFFRSGVENPVSKEISLNVYHTVQILQERQAWLTEYLTQSDYDNLKFVGKYDASDDYKTIVDDIRKTLNLKTDWARNLPTWEDALDYLTEQIENAGIIVVFNGIVGNNTRRIISPDECRGFVLVDQKAPFLFVNAADAKAAQMFTLAHELAHIWIGQTAGFDNADLLPANHPTEILCDQVAAELLVPEDEFKKEWKEVQDFRKLSKIFKVSQIVIARRALDLKLITKQEFFSFYNSYIEGWKQKKKDQKEKGGGGNFYATARKRISRRFASFVNHAVEEGNLLYRDAYRLTSLKGDTYQKFMNEYLY